MTVDSGRKAATAREVLRRSGGLAPLRQFVDAGLSGPDLGRLRHLGVVLRPRIGWYVDPATPQSGVRAVRVGGVLGCTSAAASWGIVVPERAEDVLGVSIAPGTTRLRRSDDATRRARPASEPRVRWHWEQRVDPPVGWRVSPLDALVQMASCVDLRWLTAAIDSARCTAQHPALLSEAEVARLRTVLPDHLRAAVDRSDARSETSGETFVRLGCGDVSVPFVPNVRSALGYKPDGLVDGWLPVEVDGMDTHAGREAVEWDRERDSSMAWFGAHPLRFTQNQAIRDTARVVETIDRVWRRGRGLRGSAVPRRRAAI